MSPISLTVHFGPVSYAEGWRIGKSLTTLLTMVFFIPVSRRDFRAIRNPSIEVGCRCENRTRYLLEYESGDLPLVLPAFRNWMGGGVAQTEKRPRENSQLITTARIVSPSRQTVPPPACNQDSRKCSSLSIQQPQPARQSWGLSTISCGPSAPYQTTPAHCKGRRQG